MRSMEIIVTENRVDSNVKGVGKMSVKKYRFYLFLVVLLAILAGALIYLGFSEQEKSYRDGILVQNEWEIEEELA